MSNKELDRGIGTDASDWEHFPHGADIGVRGRGPDAATAFEQAALAMSAIVTCPHGIATNRRVAIAVEAPDMEILLVRWLNAIIYEMATRSMLFGRFEVTLREGCLDGAAWGEPVDVARHEPVVELKGATLTELRVEGDRDRGWIAQCVVDV